MADRVARHIVPVDSGIASSAEASAAEVARVGVRDAVDFGIVGTPRRGICRVKGGRRRGCEGGSVSRSKAGGADSGDAGDDAAENRVGLGCRTGGTGMKSRLSPSRRPRRRIGELSEREPSMRREATRVRQSHAGSGKEQGDRRQGRTQCPRRRRRARKARRDEEGPARRTWLRSARPRQRPRPLEPKAAEKPLERRAPGVASVGVIHARALAGVLAGILAFIIGLLLDSPSSSRRYSGFWETRPTRRTWRDCRPTSPRDGLDRLGVPESTAPAGLAPWADHLRERMWGHVSGARKQGYKSSSASSGLRASGSARK